MRFLVLLLLAFISCLVGCKPNSNAIEHEKNIYRDSKNHENYNVRIKVSNSWIKKLQQFGYKRDTKSLLNEFESFIKPDSLFHPESRHIDADYGRVFNPIFVNLDEDLDNELICLLGWDIGTPYLTVFKQIKGQWYLLYLEDIRMFNEETELSVANNFSKNKVFYCRHLNGTGTCTYADSYVFYKLINNKVYRCLELVNELNSCGLSPPLNRNISTNFRFGSDNDDGLSVNYNYEFFYTPEDQSGGASSSDISIIKGQGSAWYNWDARTCTYKLDIPNYNNADEDLNAEKIACFEKFVDDTLVIKAFSKQINHLLKTGTSQQKRILKKIVAGKSLTH